MQFGLQGALGMQWASTAFEKGGNCDLAAGLHPNHPTAPIPFSLQVSATRLGTLASATHQVAMQVRKLLMGQVLCWCHLVPIACICSSRAQGSWCLPYLFRFFSPSLPIFDCWCLNCRAPCTSLQVFWCLTYFVEPFSLAAQSLIARDRYSRPRAAAWAWLLLRAGSALGVALAAVLVGIYQVSQSRAECWGRG